MVVRIYDLSRKGHVVAVSCRAVSWPCHSVLSYHADVDSSLAGGYCTLRLFFTLLRSRDAVACNCSHSISISVTSAYPVYCLRAFRPCARSLFTALFCASLFSSSVDQ
jgi:hypothetical protein